MGGKRRHEPDDIGTRIEISNTLTCKITSHMFALKRRVVPPPFGSWFYCGKERWQPTLFATHYEAEDRNEQIEDGTKYHVVPVRVVVEEKD